MNLLKKIEALFSTETPAVEVKFAEVKSKDGSILRVTEEVAVGAKVEIINEDGTFTAPTTPEIELEDGTILMVNQDGLITDIKEAEAKPEDEVEGEMAEAETEEEKPAEEAPAKDDTKRIDALETKVEELITAVNTLIESLQGKESEMEAVKKENEELSKKASPNGANFKKFDKQVDVTIQTKPLTTLERIVQKRNNK